MIMEARQESHTIVHDNSREIWKKVFGQGIEGKDDVRGVRRHCGCMRMLGLCF
jgi:hypothetical protein